jgi:hypothetical protein
MLAVPLRAEFRAQARRGVIGALEMCAVVVALYALAGRLEDFNVGPWHAVLIAAAVLLMTALYTLPSRRIHRRLERIEPLTEPAEAMSPTTVRWFWLWAIGAGLVLGGFGLVVDVELDIVAIFIAVGLGGTLGGPAYEAWAVGRYERRHGGTVYRLEDPPGTEAGLGWLPASGQ